MNGVEFVEWCRAEYESSGRRPRPLVMGILNVTPDSFFDGGRYISVTKAYDQAMRLIDEGVDLLDIGGESTRPGATPVELNEELDRVIPLIEQIRKTQEICISIDTYKPTVMTQAVGVGANCINDVYALRAPQALSTAVHLGVPVCLMHMQGQPQSMQANPVYPKGVVAAIQDFFEERIQACLAVGFSRDRLILDPGFGFGKTIQHNVALIRAIAQFRRHQLPLLLGVSRKSTIGALTGASVDDRLGGGLALAVFAVLHGVGIIRTHDVAQTRQALTMIDAIEGRLNDAA